MTEHEILLEKAIALARELHKGQRDKGGSDYIEHPLRVMESVRNAGAEAMIVALLHDTIEDSRITPAKLRSLGFPAQVVEAVEILTKQAEEEGGEAGYDSFVERIAASGSRLAIVVKLADLADNLRLERLARLPTEADLVRAQKYTRARKILETALAELGKVAEDS